MQVAAYLRDTKGKDVAQTQQLLAKARALYPWLSGFVPLPMDDRPLERHLTHFLDRLADSAPLATFVDDYFTTLMGWTPDELREHKDIAGNNYPASTFAFCKSWFRSGTGGMIAAWDSEEDDHDD